MAKGDVHCETGLDASIQHPRDAVITVAACAICGADVHRYGGITPAVERGDVRSFFDLIAVFGGAWLGAPCSNDSKAGVMLASLR